MSSDDFVVDLNQVKEAKKHEECSAKDYYLRFAEVFDHDKPLDFHDLIPLRICSSCMTRLSQGMMLAMMEMNKLSR